MNVLLHSTALRTSWNSSTILFPVRLVFPKNQVITYICVLDRRLSELHDLVTEAFLCPWSEEHRFVVESSVVSESVYDSILRVEGALSSDEIPNQEDCEIKRRKNHCFKRAIPKITRFLSQIVVVNLKQLNTLCKSSPIQQIFKKL